MRIAHVGNPANVGEIISRAQSKTGHDVEFWPRDRFRLPKGLRWLELTDYDVLHLHSFRLLPHAFETMVTPARVVIHHHGSDVRGKGPPLFAKYAHHQFCNYDLTSWCDGEAIPLPVENHCPWHRIEESHVFHSEGQPHKAGFRFVYEACKDLNLSYGPHSRIDHNDALSFMGRSSVVIGKVTRWSGLPGMVCLEAMSMGKPALCYVSPQVLALMPGSCPVVPVTPESLKTVLRAVMSSANMRQDLGGRGKEYVARHHDPGRIAARCLEVY